MTDDSYRRELDEMQHRLSASDRTRLRICELYMETQDSLNVHGFTRGVLELMLAHKEDLEKRAHAEKEAAAIRRGP